MARGRGTFGLTSSRGRGNFRGGSFRGGGWRGRGRGRGRGGAKSGDGAPKREDDGTQLAERFERIAVNDEIDEKLGFARVEQGGRKEGWLVNMHAVSAILLFLSSSLNGLEDALEGSGLSVWKSRRGLLLS